MQADRQTERQTDTQTRRNTSHDDQVNITGLSVCHQYEVGWSESGADPGFGQGGSSQDLVGRKSRSGVEGRKPRNESGGLFFLTN